MNKTLLCAALAGVIATGAATVHAADKNAGKEKCYGIAKAGKNDCKSASGSHSCAGHATKDNDPNEWNFVKEGECAKMGGTVDAGGAMMMKK
jgi:uncharacterized membrane protein